MNRRRDPLLALITVVGTVALCLSLAEVVLRFLPVRTAMYAVPVNATSSVFHFTPNRDFIFSRDWDMVMVNHGHINNAGFVNDKDYRKDDKTPLLAVVGDSFIEAAMVPFQRTVHGRLAKAFAGKLRVYSFGASGAPLSQYLIWASYAVREYGATALLINVVGNDFDESLAKYKIGPGFWLYVRNAQGNLHLQLFPYQPTILGKLVRMSALARYLVFSLHIEELGTTLRSQLLRPANAEPRFAGNTTAEASAARVKDSLMAIDAFFRDLRDRVRLPPDHVAFAMDGFRYPQNAAAGKGTYFDLMRHAFRNKAEALGYEVVDLDPAFFARYARTGERYEYPRDGHWNAIGHQICFEAVMASRLLKRLIH